MAVNDDPQEIARQQKICPGCNVLQPWEHRCFGSDKCCCMECNHERMTRERETVLRQETEQRLYGDSHRDLWRETDDLRAAIQAERDRAKLINGSLAAKAVKAREDTARLEHYLRNLLAVIHRDGGHYVDKHGLEKASLDAETIVFNGRR